MTTQVRRYLRRYRPSAILVEKAANGHALMSVLKRRLQPAFDVEQHPWAFRMMAKPENRQ
jgi:hypothetical protein